MKVLIIQPPHYFDGKFRSPGFFPVGLGHLIVKLHEENHEVEVFDIWAKHLSDEEVVRTIPSLEYDIVGITSLSTQYKYVKWLAQQLKQHNDAPIVVGGPLGTFSAKEVLKHMEVDVCVLSEGDIIFPNLIKNLGELEKVNGIVYSKNGEVIQNPPEKLIRDLDSLGFAVRDRNIFETETYIKEGYLFGYPEIRTLNVMTNRGCPWQCNFCSKTFKSARLRSIPHVLEEIRMLKEEFGVGAIFFNDELLIMGKKRGYELCEALKPLNIKWCGQARVDTVELDLLKCMKDAGCVDIGLGIESGSQRILDAMNKRSTVEKNISAIEAVKEAGLNTVAQCIYGYPGENSETVNETIDFFRRADALHQGFFVLTPLPGTTLYNQCIEKGVIVNEDEYLSNLDAGYNTSRDALVNLTDFSIDEFYETKDFMEDRIMRNYFFRHPFKQIVVRDDHNNLKHAFLGGEVFRTALKRISKRGLIKKNSRITSYSGKSI
tara:strand:+ start:145 stop:1611 length:1467 start_codon:yes stop_codon:yes gene_type:complete